MPKSILLISAITALFILSSCGDDAVVPPSVNEFDPPRYNWTVDTINADLSDIWAADSNNVFLSDVLRGLFYYNGITYQIFNYPPGVAVDAMDGYDKNNVFLGGSIGSPPARYLNLIKWNGSVFEQIYVSDTNSPHAIISIFVKSPLEIWFGTTGGRVYRYNGISVDVFYFDSLKRINPIFEDEGGNICFGGNTFYPDFQNLDSVVVDIHRYQNNFWQNIYTRTYTKENLQTGYAIRNAEREIMGTSMNTLSKFTGNDFQPLSNVGSYLLFPDYFGISSSDLICGALKTGGTNYELFHWNGQKWSKEEIILKDLPVSPFGLGNKYYIACYDRLFDRSYIHRGTKLN